MSSLFANSGLRLFKINFLCDRLLLLTFSFLRICLFCEIIDDSRVSISLKFKSKSFFDFFSVFKLMKVVIKVAPKNCFNLRFANSILRRISHEPFYLR